MKKVILLVICLFAAIAAFDIAKGFLDAIFNGRRVDSYAGRLVEVSRLINARLPEQIDKDTRWDTTMAGPGNRLTYLYTLVNISSADVDPVETAAQMKPKLVNGYKTLREMARFRDRQVELHYHFRDTSGNEPVTIVVSPKDF